MPTRPNRSLIDGMAVLQALAQEHGPLGTRELARRLGQPPARIGRLLTTLRHLGLARQDPERRYRIGPGIHLLAAQSLLASDLVRRALVALQPMSVGPLTLALAVCHREQACFLLHAIPGQPLAEGIGRAHLSPARRCAVGRVLLALGDARDAVADDAGWTAERALIRTRGWELYEHRRSPRLAALAVPVGDPAYAAIAASGNLRARDVPALLARLRTAAAAIAAG